MTISLYLVRHGQTNVNLQDATLVNGLYPQARLTAKGHTQAESLGRYFTDRQINFDRVYCSSIQRARHTLQSLHQKHPIDLDSVIYDYTLRERSQGKWEGKTQSEVYTLETVQQIHQQGSWFTPPGGESYQDLTLRAANWFHQEFLPLPTETTPESSVLIISHCLFIRALLHYIFGFSEQYFRKIKIKNTSITELTLSPTGITCQYVNTTPHLN